MLKKKFLLTVALSAIISSAYAAKIKNQIKPEDFKLAKTGKFSSLPTNEHIRIKGQNYTTITITDKVKANNLARIGVNTGHGGSTQNDASKLRSVINFEGKIFRSCVKILKNTDGNLVLFGAPEDRYAGGIYEIYKNGALTFISGAHKGEKAKILELKRVIEFLPQWGKEVSGYELTLDKKFTNAVPMIQKKKGEKKPKGWKPKSPDGVLIENLNLQTAGSFNPHYWWSQNVKIEQENRPGGTGKVSGRFSSDGTKKGYAHIRLSGSPNSNKGEAITKFWAKKVEGSPELKVVFGTGQEVVVELTEKWKLYTVKMDAAKFTDYAPQIVVTGKGQVLVDEIENYVGGDTNPTPFRDDFIATLKELDIGIFRVLQMGGNTIENMLRPRVEETVFGSSPWYLSKNWKEKETRGRDGTYSFHEVCRLAEYMNIDPWYCIPGTLHNEEMDLLMEFLGGPKGTKGGDMRIALGHEKPWTKSLRQINIEYGNEQWNLFGPYAWGGFGGADYWHDLTARAKASPYYKKNIIFHAGSQNVSKMQAAGHCVNNGNMDRVSTAPYIWFRYNPWEEHLINTGKADLFKTVYADCLDNIAYKMGMVADELKKGGMEGMSIYEYNYHVTAGSGPLYERYRITQSLGGAINLANGMLYMQKELNTKEQNVFMLGGAKESHDYYVNSKRYPSWGITYLDEKTGKTRIKPFGYALSLMNKAIFAGGDSVQTKHKGDDPVFEAVGRFGSVWTDIKKGEYAKMTDIPLLWSYAFKKDNKRSILLINLDTEKDHVIEIIFSGSATNVESWILTHDKIDANNYNKSFAQMALENEFLYSMQIQLGSKEWKAKYTEKYLANKNSGELAQEMFTDLFIPLKETPSLFHQRMKDSAARWIKNSAKKQMTLNKMLKSIAGELGKVKQSNPARLPGDVKKTFLTWVEKHSKEHKPMVELEKIKIKNFKTGSKINVPKHSMQVIRWEE